MAEVVLRVRAPFAAFRPFQAGSYRATTPVMPPSVAYGLLLNLAGIDARDPASFADGEPTRFRSGLPEIEVAVGTLVASESSVVLQQLHQYPVGNSGKELAPRTHGAKYWIAPVKREVLVGYDGAIAARGLDETFVTRLRDAVRGAPHRPRYGLPFLGDNNFLLDRVEETTSPVGWYVPCSPTGTSARGSCRLTVSIDRTDSSRTRTLLFAPSAPSPAPPSAAFVRVP